MTRDNFKMLFPNTFGAQTNIGTNIDNQLCS